MTRKRRNEELEKIEELERANKSLRTLNRSLMRHLKKLDRGFKFEPTDDGDIEEEFNQKNKCPDCGKGFLVEVPMGPKYFMRCELCLWRSKTMPKRN